MVQSIMSKLLVFIFLIYLDALVEASASNLDVNRQPRYVPGVVSIIQDHSYIRTHRAPIYWQISPYYLPQPTDASCSAASATMLINALRIPQMLYANQKLATMDSVVRSINTNEWENAVKQGGDGVSLEQFGLFLTQAIKAYHISPLKLELIHATGDKEVAIKFHQALMDGEKTGGTFVIVNFDQKFISGTESVGHFAPVGAYDITKKRVLIMDPDGELFEPYWVPEQRLLVGMTTKDSSTSKYRGFVIIVLKGKT